MSVSDEALFVGPHIDASVQAADLSLAKDIGDKLTRDYPGWLWAVEIPPNQGVVILRNLSCNVDGKFGFVIKRKVIDGDPGLKSVMRAAGEFLERYRKRRGAWREGDDNPMFAGAAVG